MANEKRLISVCDATAVYNGICLYMAENAYLNDTALDVLKMVASWLNDAPTVDAVEVVHARWIKGKYPGEYTCSRCGMQYCEADHTAKPYKYCPECGNKNE